MPARCTPPVRNCRHSFLEALEDRRLLACQIYVDDQSRTLYALGDEADNKIAIVASQGALHITCDGMSTGLSPKRFDSAVVDAGDGDDDVTMRDQENGLGDKEWNVNLGAGGDHFDARSSVPTGNLSLILNLNPGGGRGGFPLPEVGDEVIVVFENGDINHPYVIGSLWNSGNSISFKDDNKDSGSFGGSKDSGHVTFHARSEGGAHSLKYHGQSARSHNAVELHVRSSGDDTSQDIAIDTADGDDTVTIDVCNSSAAQRVASQIAVNTGDGNDNVNLKLASAAALLNQKVDIHTGGGGDTVKAQFSGMLSTPGGSWNTNMDTDEGDDSVLLYMDKIPAGPLLAVPPLAAPLAIPAGQALNIRVNTGNKRDNVQATIQDVGVDLHLDVELGAASDKFTATVMPDRVPRGLSDIEPGYDIAVGGGSGTDEFSVAVGDVNTPGPDDDSPLPQLRAELEISFDGGRGGDAFLIGLLNVAISGPVTILEDGGAGNDSFRDTFSRVAAGGGAWNIVHQGRAGNDSLQSSFFDVFADLSVGADLGSGNDTVVIAIIRSAGPGGSSVLIQVAAGEGNDDVTVAVDKAIEDFTATLDGGDGRDITHVTQNVQDKGAISKFEKIKLIPYVT